MPVVNLKPYKPPLHLRNGHINTLWTYFYRKVPVLKSVRTRLDTHDGDFLDLDLITAGNSKSVLLLHGLEGSSQSQYIVGMADLFSRNGYDVIMINHRSCSGEMNKMLTMYHSGFTDDLHLVSNWLNDRYNSFSIIGFSMGGNMALKYLGDGLHVLPNKLKAAVGVSVPCDLGSSSRKITHWTNYLYDKNFLQTLIKKANIKAEQFPELINSNDLKKIKSLVTFDEYFTGPIHGFTGAQDYYDQSNSLQYLPSLQKPALLINSLDDPFLTPTCFPFEIAENSKLLHFTATRYGGHVGFMMKGRKKLFVDDVVFDFIESI